MKTKIILAMANILGFRIHIRPNMSSGYTPLAKVVFTNCMEFVTLVDHAYPYTIDNVPVCDIRVGCSLKYSVGLDQLSGTGFRVSKTQYVVHTEKSILRDITCLVQQ